MLTSLPKIKVKSDREGQMAYVESREQGKQQKQAHRYRKHFDDCQIGGGYG